MLTEELPQQLLNELHALELPALFGEQMDSAAREQAIKLTKQKLRATKKKVSQEMTAVKARWDGRRRGEAQMEVLHLKPYQLLESLINRIEISLDELETRGGLAQHVEIGAQIVGNLHRGEWLILSDLEAEQWREADAKRIADDRQHVIANSRALLTAWEKEAPRISQSAPNAILFVCGMVGVIVVMVLLDSTLGVIFIAAILAFVLILGAIIVFYVGRQRDQRIAALVGRTIKHLEDYDRTILELETVIESTKPRGEEPKTLLSGE